MVKRRWVERKCRTAVVIGWRYKAAVAWRRKVEHKSAKKMIWRRRWMGKEAKSILLANGIRLQGACTTYKLLA